MAPGERSQPRPNGLWPAPGAGAVAGRSPKCPVSRRRSRNPQRSGDKVEPNKFWSSLTRSAWRRCIIVLRWSGIGCSKIRRTRAKSLAPRICRRTWESLKKIPNIHILTVVTIHPHFNTVLRPGGNGTTDSRLDSRVEIGGQPLIVSRYLYIYALNQRILKSLQRTDTPISGAQVLRRHIVTSCAKSVDARHNDQLGRVDGAVARATHRGTGTERQASDQDRNNYFRFHGINLHGEIARPTVIGKNTRLSPYPRSLASCSA